MSPNNRLLRPIQRFTIRKVDSTVVLFLATILALIVANSPLRDLYHTLLAIPINLNILGLDIFHYHGEPMSFLVFANDVLMVFFFFVVGLDIKQQLLVGELSSVKKAMMPVVGAIGGMIVPIVLFLLIAPAGDASRGAAIPMATDIAFVLAVLMVLKDHVPASLRVFMTTLLLLRDQPIDARSRLGDSCSPSSPRSIRSAPYSDLHDRTLYRMVFLPTERYPHHHRRCHGSTGGPYDDLCLLPPARQSRWYSL